MLPLIALPYFAGSSGSFEFRRFLFSFVRTPCSHELKKRLVKRKMINREIQSPEVAENVAL
jgi:hypothetical protein